MRLLLLRGSGNELLCMPPLSSKNAAPLSQRLVALLQVFLLFITIWKHFSSSYDLLIPPPSSSSHIPFIDYWHEELKLASDLCGEPMVALSCPSFCLPVCVLHALQETPSSLMKVMRETGGGADAEEKGVEIWQASACKILKVDRFVTLIERRYQLHMMLQIQSVRRSFMALKECRCRPNAGGNAGETCRADEISTFFHYFHVSPSQEVSKTINITKRTC